MTDWCPIYENTLANVLAAVIGGGAVFVWNRYRNVRLEGTLRTAFVQHGIAMTAQGFGIAVHNRTPVTILVRKITVWGGEEQGSIKLNYEGPTGEVGLEHEGDGRTLPRVLFWSTLDNYDEDRGFVIMPPHTGGTWVIRHELLTRPSWFFTRCVMILEYPTMFGGRALLRVEANEDYMRDFRQLAEDYPRWRGLPQ